MNDPIVPPLKRCCKCGEEKPATLEVFGKHKDRSDGLQSQCKKCRSVKKVVELTGVRKCTSCLAEYPATTEYFHKCKGCQYGLQSQCKTCLNKKTKEWYSENQEHAVQQKREYVQANKEKVLQSTRATYQKNRERYLEDKKRYVAENPEKLREHWRRMHKMRDNAPGSHTKEQELALHDEQEGRCGYCGIALHGDWVPDHRHPVALGGSHDIENIVVCCPVCNNGKSKLTLDVWMSRRGW